MISKVINGSFNQGLPHDSRKLSNAALEWLAQVTNKEARSSRVRSKRVLMWSHLRSLTTAEAAALEFRYELIW
jgi:hypothetical protein